MRQLSANGERGLRDLFFFLTEFWGLELWENPHKALCAEIEAAEEDKDSPYAMLCVHRGSRKTSIARGAAVWKQLRQVFLFDNLFHRIVFAGATLPLGEATLRVIESGLRYNKKLIAEYGTMWKDDRAAKKSSRHPEGLVLWPRVEAGDKPGISEPSFWIGSVRRISTGFHADEAVVDDLNNNENTSTDHQRLKVQQYWDMLFPIINPEDLVGRPSRVTMLCTPYHDDDVGGRISRAERDAVEAGHKSKWHILRRGCYNEDGSAFFPQKYPLDILENLRERMSPREFSANFLCDPVGDRGFVEESQIIFRSRDTFPPLKTIRATVDPNQHKAAKELGCYVAIGVSGYDRFANLYFLDVRGSREWGATEFIDELFLLQEEYPDIPILIEDEHMSYLEHSIKLEEAHRSSEGERKHLRIQWIPAGRNESKYDKWQKVQPRFRTGRIIFAEEIEPKIKAEIREELVRGQAARFKDFLDMIAMAEIGIRPKVAKDGQMVDQTAKLEGSRKPIPGLPTMAQLVPGIERMFQQ